MSKYLKTPVQTINLEKIHTISDLLKAFNRTSFQSRNLAGCVEVFLEMLEDQERPTIFLGLAGAMVPAGMGGVVSTMIKNRMIDVLVSTGANMYHDLVEAFGVRHYIGSPRTDDVELNKLGIDRIYDTFADESKFRMVDKMVEKYAFSIAEKIKDPVSSRFFLKKLGEFIEAKAKLKEKKTSIIWNSWKNEIPIFVPALNDSSIGLALTQHFIKCLDLNRKPIVIDEIKDNYEIFKIKKSSKKTGVIYVGGGVPKNYIQQTAYLQDLFGLPDAGHDYGIQITTDPAHWGGLSGCTFKEGLSWGKEKPRGKYVTCYCDATISMPLIVKAILERCKVLKNREKIHFSF